MRTRSWFKAFRSPGRKEAEPKVCRGVSPWAPRRWNMNIPVHNAKRAPTERRPYRVFTQPL
jgi:hypothetical protein